MKSANMSRYVALCLLDGSPRRVGDFLPFLLRNLNPSLAARAYDRARRSDAARRGYRNGAAGKPLEYRVRHGGRAVVNYTFWHMKHRGLLAVEKPAGDKTSMEDWWVRLTPLGLEKLRDFGRGGSGGRMFEALRRLWAAGKIDLAVTIPEYGEVTDAEQTENSDPAPQAEVPEGGPRAGGGEPAAAGGPAA